MTRERELKTGYLPSLDGWRAIAILSVMMFHDAEHHIGRFSDSLLHKYGYIGVDLFFAISGLLICTRLLEEDRVHGRISLRGFYIRRLFRIAPAAWTFLVVCALLGIVQQVPLDLGGIVSSVLMIRNLYMPWDGVGGSGWLTVHFWSLSVEEHFYLLLPGLLVFGKRWRTKLVGLLAVLFILWMRIVLGSALRHAEAVHQSLDLRMALTLRSDMRLHELLIPAFFALLLAKPSWKNFATRWVRPWAVISLLLLYVLAIRRAPWFPYGGAAFSSLVISVGLPLVVISTVYHPRAWLTRVLEIAPMKFVGRISYGLYLWQQLFFIIPEVPLHAPVLYLQRSPFCYFAIFACALISYYLVERPLIRMGHRIAHPVIPGHADLELTSEVARVPSESLPATVLRAD